MEKGRGNWILSLSLSLWHGGQVGGLLAMSQKHSQSNSSETEYFWLAGHCSPPHTEFYISPAPLLNPPPCPPLNTLSLFICISFKMSKSHSCTPTLYSPNPERLGKQTGGVGGQRGTPLLGSFPFPLRPLNHQHFKGVPPH